MNHTAGVRGERREAGTAPAPRVSIGMPAYNAERFIRTAIDGILAQSHSEFELVIADNASTDRSAEICAEYARRDPRIRFYRNSENIGASANFNRVFHLSRGRYFMWASANDYFAPDFLERAVPVLDARPDVVICCAQTRYFSGEPAHYREVDDPMNIDMTSPVERFGALLQRMTINNVMHGLIRSAALMGTARIGDYFSSDIVLVAELALQGKFLQLPAPLYYRRMEEKAATLLMTQEELHQFYWPKARLGTAAGLQLWKLHAGYWRMVMRAPLGLRDRSRVARMVLRNTVWDRAKLAGELRDTLRGWLPSGRASAGERRRGNG